MRFLCTRNAGESKKSHDLGLRIKPRRGSTLIFVSSGRLTASLAHLGVDALRWNGGARPMRVVRSVVLGGNLAHIRFYGHAMRRLRY